MANHDQCCANPPTLNPAFGQGVVVDDLAGLRAYTVGDSTSNLAILIVSDVFGFGAPNLRKLADKVAASGFFVVVPDLLRGDPLDTESQERPFPVWIQSHSPNNASDEAKKIIAALKNRGVSSVGAVGFCWGGKVVTELAKAGELGAVVLLHPSFVSVEDIKEVKCPIAILGAEIDHVSPPELVKQFELVLSEKEGANYLVKIFPGLAHGWACRYDSEDSSACQSADTAHDIMLDWFVKYVK